MNESAKTGVFVSVAVAAVAILLVVSWANRPSLPPLDPTEMVGKPLFAEFDPLSVTDLKIAKYDESTGDPQAFQVAQVDDQWSIPSHNNYPTDAKDQLAEAAASVLGLKVAGFVTQSPGDHSMYGVLDPTSKELESGAEGVGTRVTMEDNDDKVLLDLIIGNEVESAKADANLHYVRRAGQSPVYTVAVKTDKLSTKFEDWIEDDLLKLSGWDIKKIEIRDYSVDETRGTIKHRGNLELTYDDTGDPKWQLTADARFTDGEWVSVEMAENEELDTDKLDELKEALDDLKIVDVRRKPEGLSADLKADEGVAKDFQSQVSLQDKGFYWAEMDGRAELVSNEGEVRCIMKDGVEYILRFGTIANTSSNGSESGGKEGEEPTEGNPNRYIFVMAEFNPDVIPKPELEPLPEQPADDAAAAEAGADADESDADGDDTDSADSDSTDADSTDADSTDADSTDADGADDTTSETDATEAEAEKADLAAERERIEKENQRKQDEYDEAVEKGKEHVRELNERFADWYYIIADDVYQKIHLGREQVVKQKEPENEDGDASADHDRAGETAPAGPAGVLGEFNELRDQGPGDE